MRIFQLLCWSIILAGFIFGISDRLLQADLYSFCIASCFAIFIIPLFPLIK